MLDRLMAARLLHAPLVAIVACLVALPGLGATGLSSSEGHRAIPGWTMLQSGDWLHIKLFGATYLRKPPGMPWAIATSSSFLGMTELAARLPSALGFAAMALLAWRMSTRWFGPPWGLIGGLAQALMPVLWPWARSAEIELLHALAAQAAAFMVIDLLVTSERGECDSTRDGGARSTQLHPAWNAAAIGFAGMAMFLLKGPAGVPAIVGAAAGACLALGAARALLNSWLWLGVLLAGAGVWVAWSALAGRNATPDAVTQDVREFLWSMDRLGAIALMPLGALAAGLPASACLLLCWSRSKAFEARVAQALAAGVLIALGIYMAMGVSNHRYALPALTMLPPLAAYAASLGLRPRKEPGGNGIEAGVRGFRGAMVAAGVLAIIAGVWIPMIERSRARHSGREAGAALARALADAAPTTRERDAGMPRRELVLADALIDARPDVLWYMERERPGARARWTRGEAFRSAQPASDLYLLARTDDGAPDERAMVDRLVAAGAAQVIHEGRLHDYSFVLLAAARGDSESASGRRPARPE
ncbi:MAG: ArnT family glycosyltransferase [Phycisphaerales bacterium]